MAPVYPATLETIIGSGLVGAFLTAPLFGIYSAQSWSYYIRFPKDKVWMKCLVVFLWLVLAAQFGLDTYTFYKYLILGFGSPTRLAIIDPDFTMFAVFDSITAFPVQCFFARRLFLLIRRPVARWALVISIVSLSAVGFAFGLMLESKASDIHLFSKLTELTWASDTWLAANVACDTLITVSMCYVLHTSRTGIKKTDRLINKLMAYSIQTGAATSVTEIICLVTATTTGFHFGHILVVFPLAGLYCISFLANLHARTPHIPGTSDDCVITDTTTTPSYPTITLSAVRQNHPGRLGRKHDMVFAGVTDSRGSVISDGTLEHNSLNLKRNDSNIA